MQVNEGGSILEMVVYAILVLPQYLAHPLILAPTYNIRMALINVSLQFPITSEKFDRHHFEQGMESGCDCLYA